MPQAGFDPPKQREDCYQSTTLPPSHHGWICQLYIVYFLTTNFSLMYRKVIFLYPYFYQVTLNWYLLSELDTYFLWRMLKGPPLNPRTYISRYSNIDPTKGRWYVRKYVRKSSNLVKRLTNGLCSINKGQQWWYMPDKYNILKI